MDNDEKATRIDLGDDLVEKTAMISTQEVLDFTSVLVPDGPGSIPDQLQSAKILMSEGLIPDSKKILHQILMIDFSNVQAKEFLKEIYEIELQEIFSGQGIQRPYSQFADSPNARETDSEDLMRQMDSDLELGIFVTNELETEEFIVELEKSLVRGSHQDWVDMGIGFLEMELFEIAIRLFSGASRRLDSEAPRATDEALSVASLLGLSLILVGRPFEAIARLQPLLRDSEMKKENKIELFYLMGRTYESMKKFDFAFPFYRQVAEIDPHYRDIELRLLKRMSE